MYLKIIRFRRWMKAVPFAAAALMCVIGITAVMLSGASSGTAALCGRESASPVRLFVVMYHGFTEDGDKQNRYMIDPEILENDLKYLTENGYHTIVTKELAEHFRSGAPLPDKPVMLTFDDGYYSNYLYAYPLLKKYNCKAVLSPIGLSCSKAENEIRQDPNYSQCTIAQLAEMRQSGLVELAYHSYDLHSLSEGVQGVQKRSGESDGEYKKRLKDDITEFRSCMLDAAGGELYCFTYPFGARSAGTEEIVKEEGFLCALDCEEKVNTLTTEDDLYSIHRFLRDGETASESYFAALKDI